jgi:hypothetical protein
MSITLVWRADAHLADDAPQSRTDDWARTVLGKIVQVGEIAKEVQADALLDGGDFFHIKSPIRNSHSLVQRIAEAHQGYPCPVYSNVGNHDVKYGNLEFLSESPLGVLFGTGVFKRLYDQHEALFVKGNLSVRVVGIPFHGTQYDMNRFTTITKGKESWLIVIVHCLASPTGGKFFEGEDVLRYTDLANLDPDIWCFGHDHRDLGVQQLGKKKWFIHVGGLSRGSIAQDEVSRMPTCAILRITEQGFRCEQRQLKVRPAAEVFDVQGKARAETKGLTMETFVDNLRQTLKTRQEGSLLDVVRGLGEIPDAVRERALAYLERAGAR